MATATTLAAEIAEDLHILNRELEWLLALSQEDWTAFSDDYQDGQRIEWYAAALAADRLERYDQAGQMSTEQSARYLKLRKALTDAEGMLVARDCVLPRFVAQKAA